MDIFVAIIQLIAASENFRPLIYAGYGDKDFVKSFSIVYNYLMSQEATVGDLYRYLEKYSKDRSQRSLFQFILHTPISLLHT